MALSIPIVADADYSEVGVIVSKSKYRGIIYSAMALAALGITVANAVFGYLVVNHVVALTDLVWLGAVNVAFPIVSGAIHGLSKANTPKPVPAPAPVEGSN